MTTKTITIATALLALTACGDDTGITSTTLAPDDGTTTTGSDSSGLISESISESITDSVTDSVTATEGGTGDSSTGETLDGTSTGAMPSCGDGVLDEGEDCDDANTDPGDGCDDACAVEEGFECTGDDVSTCAAVCGDGLVLGDEMCDDANTNDGDGCLSTCQFQDGFECTGEPSVCGPLCGDGQVYGDETCDDANTDDDDGCSSLCQTENGYVCLGLPSVCNSICGDSIVASDEGCDDGNIAISDGCNSMCQVENGFTCMGEPSTCDAICGDGLVLGGEECDDANLMVGDGCDDICLVEAGYGCQGEPSVCMLCGGNGYSTLQLTELNIGTPDYVDLTNTGMCDIDLTGLNILFDDSSLSDLDFALPAMMILPGQTLRIQEDGMGDIDTASNIFFSSVRGGATLLCTGSCADAMDVLDVVAFSEGAPHGPLPAGVTFAPAGLTGLVSEATEAYVRIDSMGVTPDFLASDWAVQMVP